MSKKIKGLNQFNQAISVKIKKNKIKKVTEIKKKRRYKNYILPGFIEIHEHGGYSFDWITSQEEPYDYLNKLAKNEGTTSLVATFITTDHKKIKKTISNNAKYVNKKNNGATLLGFHLEGPFISKTKKGAHPEKYIEPLTLKAFNNLISKKYLKYIKILTFAPESTSVGEIKQINNLGIKLQIGHSAANNRDYQKVKPFVSGVTHFNNAMNKIYSQEDSFAQEVIKNNYVYIEYINDGIHNSPFVAKDILNKKPKDKVIFVTDALSVKGLDPGEYDGPNGKIINKDNAAWTEDGILNGSVLSLATAFKKYVKETGATINDAVMATSTNAGKYLKLNKGKIVAGYDADIVILNKELNVVKTYVNGKEVK